MGLVLAEIRKLTSITTTWVLTGIGLLLVGLFAGVFTFVGQASGGPFTGADRQLALAIEQIGGNSVIVLVVALLMMTTEFRHGTVGRTLQITPSRTRVMAAKLAVGAVYAVVFMLIGLVVVAIILGIAAGAGSTGLSLGAASGTAVWHGFAGLILTALLGVAIGALIRSQVVALTLMLVWVFVLESLINFAAPRIGRWMPFNALNAMFISEEATAGAPEGMIDFLDPTMGLLVFLGYVAVAAVVAVVLMRTRDV